MSDTLKVSIGQHSDKGCKEVNQDFHGACVPQGLALAAKGVVVALADGGRRGITMERSPPAPDRLRPPAAGSVVPVGA